MNFLTVSSVTGAGKTYAAIDNAIELAALGVNTVFVMPTLEVIDRTVADLVKRKPSAANYITVIVSERSELQKVTLRITEFTKTAPRGCVLFITQEAFVRQPHWHRRAQWHVTVDEVIETTYNEVFKLYENRDQLTGRLALQPHGHKFSRITVKEDGDAWANNAYGDGVNALFTGLAGKLKDNSHWACFVNSSQWAAFCDGAVTLEVHGLLAPSVFDEFQSVTLMAANLELSITYLWFVHTGCEFKPHGRITNRLRYHQHTNGARMTIYYLTERSWSKKLRDRNDGEMLKLMIDIAEQKFAGQQYLWVANNDVKSKAMRGTRLENKPHGLNHYQNYNNIVILSALNATAGHQEFLTEFAGITDQQRRRAMLSQTAYQALGRGSMRDPEAACPFTVFVPDRQTAEDILAMYPGAEMLPVLPYDPAPLGSKNGRPPGDNKRYRSAAEKQCAYRARKRAHALPKPV